MPLYEYQCADCSAIFDQLRPFDEADRPIPCSICSSKNTKRKLSTFFAHNEQGSIVQSSEKECASCSDGSCSTCH